MLSVWNPKIGFRQHIDIKLVSVSLKKGEHINCRVNDMDIIFSHITMIFELISERRVLRRYRRTRRLVRRNGTDHQDD